MAKAIEDKEPNVTALLREVGEGIRAGKLEEAKFTPAMWTALSPQIKDLQAASGQDGELKSVELLARWEEGDQKHYRYRMARTRRTHLVTLVLDKEGRVAGLWAEEE